MYCAFWPAMVFGHISMAFLLVMPMAAAGPVLERSMPTLMSARAAGAANANDATQETAAARASARRGLNDVMKISRQVLEVIDAAGPGFLVRWRRFFLRCR
jgi:hypothetical protein